MQILTSAWIKTRSDQYSHFVLPQTVAEYCAQEIDPVSSEINETGIVAITEVLLQPAGVSLEVIYLDRSEGSEANVHHYGLATAPQSTIRLLYRPCVFKPNIRLLSLTILQRPL